MMWSKGCVCMCVCEDKEGDVDFLGAGLCSVFLSHYLQHTSLPSLPFLPLLIDFVKEITLTCPRLPHSLPLCSQVVFTIFLYGKSLRNVEEVGVSFRSMNLMWLGGWRGGWGQLFQYLTKFQVLSQRGCWLQVTRGCRPLAALIKGDPLISSASVHTSSHMSADGLLKLNTP